MEEIQKTLTYFIQDHFLAAKDTYDEAVDYFHKALNKFAKVGISAYDGSTDSSSYEATKPSALQLPCIELLKFFGKFSEWQNFRHMFETLVGNDVEHIKVLLLKIEC